MYLKTHCIPYTNTSELYDMISQQTIDIYSEFQNAVQMQ